VIRNGRDRPGEIIHMDIKKLGKCDRVGHRITGDRHGQSSARGIGWEFVHVCVDDHSRLAFSQVRKSERKECAMAVLIATVALYKRLGIKIERLMTDNGSCYRAKAFNRLSRPWVFAIFTPSSTHPKPTARPSASFSQASGNGLMPRPIKSQIRGRRSCPTGRTITIGTGPTPR